MGMAATRDRRAGCRSSRSRRRRGSGRRARTAWFSPMAARVGPRGGEAPVCSPQPLLTRTTTLARPLIETLRHA